jgi:hypothetical protein
VVPVAVDLDDQLCPPVHVVDPPDPGLTSEVDLAVGRLDPRRHQDSEEEGLQPAGRRDVCGSPLGEQPTHERAALTAVPGELDGDPAQCIEVDQLHGQGVVEGPLDPARMDLPGQIEDRAGYGGHRHPIEHRLMTHRQAAWLVQDAHAGPAPRRSSPPGDVQAAPGEARQAPEQGRCLMGDD